MALPISCSSTVTRFRFVADPDKNFLMIVKDGKIYKNNSAAKLTASAVAMDVHG
ncbi:hypothetical protein FHX08_005676 [Rhizobium sp. BK529]|uniref:hypothetical protein n=1 Tax=Rhizobium sp. BK529 TaxID=2586983 RepID=UPI00161D331C|nr:hypothetical protein [Rhizobium sp. BK529]MBB3595264.1 hypothetical protein [Rhizobium sp. BK529]